MRLGLLIDEADFVVELNGRVPHVHIVVFGRLYQLDLQGYGFVVSTWSFRLFLWCNCQNLLSVNWVGIGDIRARLIVKTAIYNFYLTGEGRSSVQI